MTTTPETPAAPAVALPSPLTALFVDLDGVLADFHTALARLYGLDPARLEEAGWAELGEWGLSIPKPGFWDSIQAEGPGWWAALPKLPWADRLWAACRAACDTVVVLTTPGPFAESAAGKYAWVTEQLGTADMLIGRPKEVCSRPGHALVDDRAGYGPRWQGEGGHLLSLRRPWNPSGHPPEAIIAALEAAGRR
jgi:hypothetical protein